MAEYDVLHDEGQAFAQWLREAGGPAVSRAYADMNHGFLKYVGVLEPADTAMQDACRWLKGVLRAAAPASASEAPG